MDWTCLRSDVVCVLLVRVISCALLIYEQDGFCLSVVFFLGPAVFHSHHLEVANEPRIEERL